MQAAICVIVGKYGWRGPEPLSNFLKKRAGSEG